jgi:two-component system catabolic regulation response regulator CreB/two-component system response regulator ChvI
MTKELSRSKVLVCDDDPDVTTIVKEGLTKHGFSVDAFNEPEKALSNFVPGKYELVILDIRMPTMNGFELFKNIRGQDTKVKVVFLTAFEIYLQEFKKLFPDSDVSMFIRKPIHVKDLESLLEDKFGLRPAHAGTT